MQRISESHFTKREKWRPRSEEERAEDDLPTSRCSTQLCFLTNPGLGPPQPQGVKTAKIVRCRHHALEFKNGEVETTKHEAKNGFKTSTPSSQAASADNQTRLVREPWGTFNLSRDKGSGVLCTAEIDHVAEMAWF